MRTCTPPVSEESADKSLRSYACAHVCRYEAWACDVLDQEEDLQSAMRLLTYCPVGSEVSQQVSK